MSIGVWLDFLLISRDETGFLRKGRPFLVFCASWGGPEEGSDAGSLLSLVPDGLLTDAEVAWCNSVGATNDVVLACLAANRSGLPARPVFIGGGGGFARDRRFSEGLLVVAAGGSEVCTSCIARRCLCRATPPRKLVVPKGGSGGTDSASVLGAIVAAGSVAGGCEGFGDRERTCGRGELS